MNFTELKVAACAINLSDYNENDNPFDYISFQQLIKLYLERIPQIKEYETYLWKFGYCLHLDNLDMEKEKSYPFQYYIDLLQNAKFLMDNADSKITISNIGKNNQSIVLDNPKYIKALLEEVRMEIEKSETNVFCYKKTEDGTSEIINDIEVEMQKPVNIVYRAFSIDDREKLEQKIKQIKYWKKKSGEDKRTKPVNNPVHYGIHALASLLRIDEFILYRNELDSIVNVTLTNNMCRFMADFLFFFEIQNKNNFTSPDNAYVNIRNIYDNIPQRTAPLICEEIIKSRKCIDELVKKIRITEA